MMDATLATLTVVELVNVGVAAEVVHEERFLAVVLFPFLVALFPFLFALFRVVAAAAAGGGVGVVVVTILFVPTVPSLRAPLSLIIFVYVPLRFLI